MLRRRKVKQHFFEIICEKKQKRNEKKNRRANENYFELLGKHKAAFDCIDSSENEEEKTDLN